MSAKSCPAGVDTPIGRGLRLRVLSNYAGNKAATMRRERHTDYELETLRHRLTLCDLNLEHWEYMRTAKAAFREFRLIDAWQAWLKARRTQTTRTRVRFAPPRVRSASIEEQQARFGDEAEGRLDDYLAEHLGEQWTLIAGYVGRGGEIDRVLVGPGGIYAFEIKGNRGIIHADETGWYAERFDRRGRLVSTRPLARAPDAQLAKAVTPLAGWLRRNGIDTPVVQIVVFTADDAKIGRIRRANADCVKTLNDLELGLLFQRHTGTKNSGPVRYERIVRLIERDHAFWESKRATA